VIAFFEMRGRASMWDLFYLRGGLTFTVASP
jgi:hypothetical protein